MVAKPPRRFHSQLATQAGIWFLALIARVAIVRGFAAPAPAVLAVGYLALLVLVPIAARDVQAPLFFARLRPPQMSIAIVSLVALLANVWLLA